ncbi:hypothetical protein [Chromobacterium vaccinii]|uniref:hypothetical protein n=1 Tax=Chromobacterium vaccinii TaxID=1108595 RepID=UPI001E377AB4|nr:hypothetical protein [Chromobacterium vaccinii]MCD4502141.1 hypothetical protein [Chromobacterium vaccinii]
MVTRVTHPLDDSVDIVRRTIEERVKFKDFYDRIKDDLVKRVELYREAQGNPKDLDPINLRDYTDSDDEALKRKGSLIGLYSPEEGKLPYHQLEKIRKENGLVVCPSCGEPGRPRTLDHYLPKNIFPEFAIVLLNLTPMCDWCQGEKLAEYITSDGRKRYIHPYFDDVSRPLFYIKFHPPYRSPTIAVDVYQSLPSELNQLVALHLEGIDFMVRFREFFKTRYVSVLRKSRDCRQPNSIGLRNYLNLCLDMEAEKSINSWDAILYRSILEDDNMMHFLENDTLPENL